MRRFSERFARWGFRAEAMTPVYGLAEAGLAVSFSDPGRPPHVREFDRRALSEDGIAVAGSGRISAGSVASADNPAAASTAAASASLIRRASGATVRKARASRIAA